MGPRDSSPTTWDHATPRPQLKTTRLLAHNSKPRDSSPTTQNHATPRPQLKTTRLLAHNSKPRRCCPLFAGGAPEGPGPVRTKQASRAAVLAGRHNRFAIRTVTGTFLPLV